MTVESVLRILLVEDNPDHALLTKNAIVSSKQRKCEVRVSGSVEEAMEQIETESVSLIVSDFHLPGKSGLEFLNWLNEKGIEIPFVMLTGSGDERTAVKALREGRAYNYIVKDGNYLNVLPHVIDETLIEHMADQERKRYEREIREKNAALEKANRELKKLDQLKSDFVSSVSHDIRTPLSSVQESIALILDGIVDPNEVKGKHILEIAKKSLVRLTTMINDLLDFSKLEAGKMQLHMEPCDVQVLVDEVLGALKSLADKKKIKFNFEPSQEFPKVACDAERIIQVLTNLVANAIKFTPESGSVTVHMEQVLDGYIHMTVADTGVGIQKENLFRIFERFEQVKGTSPAGEKGTGLGLAICQELVKLHGGEIWAESEPGKGSQFTLSLPIRQKLPVEKITMEERVA